MSSTRVSAYLLNLPLPDHHVKFSRNNAYFPVQIFKTYFAKHYMDQGWKIYIIIEMTAYEG